MQILRLVKSCALLGRVRLREMDDVDRRLALVHELLDRVRQRDLGVGVLQRHRAIAGLHGDGRRGR